MALWQGNNGFVLEGSNYLAVNNNVHIENGTLAV
jgi:hypothetical protein